MNNETPDSGFWNKCIAVFNVAKPTFDIIKIILGVGGTIALVFRSKDSGNIITIITIALCLLVSIFTIIFIIKSYGKKIELKEEAIKDLNTTLSLQKVSVEVHEALSKKIAIYPKMFTYLNKAFEDLRYAENDEAINTSETNYKMAFQAFCTIISTAFKEMTGKDCHVCIKYIQKTGTVNTMETYK